PENKNKSKYTLTVEDTILGIIVGMALEQRPNGSRSNFSVRDDMPLIALAEASPDSDTSEQIATDGIVGASGERVKVSGRMKRDLVDKGVHLGEAMKQAATRVKGAGGGHNVAAGATIPKRKIKAFLQALDEEVGGQMARFTPSERP
ncbi:MAG TPA: DHH family phosphoesterase, partial [Methanomassiliicoccales archaeon]|nr:DHH family phosphoesterase [Methanomassiliicoccales archaeon]